MENKQTAVEWLVEKLNSKYGNDDFIITHINEIEHAKQLEKQQIIEEIIGFQIYLHDEGYITSHDWNFVKEAIYYLHQNQIK